MQWVLRWITSSAPSEDRRAAHELAKIKLSLHPAAAWRLGIVLLMGPIAVIVAILGGTSQLIGTILAAGALAVGYIEWVLGRHENSIDKFYEKVVLANNYRREISGELGISEIDLYVFSELDILEYVIERYRPGYISAVLALRGVRTFQSRLQDIDGFRDRVRLMLMMSDCG